MSETVPKTPTRTNLDTIWETIVMKMRWSDKVQAIGQSVRLYPLWLVLSPQAVTRTKASWIALTRSRKVEDY